MVVTGLVGGRAGQQIVEGLQRENILNDFVHIGGESRTSTAVVDPTTMTQTEIIEYGPVVTAQELDAFLDKIEYLAKGARFVVLAGSLPRKMPEDFYAGRHAARPPAPLLRRARQRRRAAAPRHARAARTSSSPNLREAEDLVGHEFHDEQDIVDATGHHLRDGRAQRHHQDRRTAASRASRSAAGSASSRASIAPLETRRQHGRLGRRLPGRLRQRALPEARPAGVPASGAGRRRRQHAALRRRRPRRRRRPSTARHRPTSSSSTAPGTPSRSVSRMSAMLGSPDNDAAATQLRGRGALPFSTWRRRSTALRSPRVRVQGTAPPPPLMTRCTCPPIARSSAPARATAAEPRSSSVRRLPGHPLRPAYFEADRPPRFNLAFQNGRPEDAFSSPPARPLSFFYSRLREQGLSGPRPDRLSRCSRPASESERTSFRSPRDPQARLCRSPASRAAVSRCAIATTRVVRGRPLSRSIDWSIQTALERYATTEAALNPRSQRYFERTLQLLEMGPRRRLADAPAPSLLGGERLLQRGAPRSYLLAPGATLRSARPQLSATFVAIPTQFYDGFHIKRANARKLTRNVVAKLPASFADAPAPQP